MENTPKRIACVVNPFTGDELKAGNRDVSQVYSLLTHPELGVCSNESPRPFHECRSRNEFFDFLAPIINNWHLKDQLVFYFSGHGTVRHGGVYCLQLGRAASDFLPFDSLMTELYASRVQRAIIILDACHSGAAIGVKESTDVFSMINEERIPKGIGVIASCRASQTSHEMEDGSESVFTKLFCEGITTGLDNQCTADGLINVGDIVTY
ncbi:Caspase domain-containing protein, partial [Candidatus Electrothrix communis]